MCIRDICDITLKNDKNGVIKVWFDDKLSPCIKNPKLNFLKANNYDGSSKWDRFHLPSNWSPDHGGLWRQDNDNSVFFDNIEIYSDQGSGASGSMLNGTISVLKAPTGLIIIRQQ